MKQSGESEWKKKVVKELDFQPGAVQEVKIREKKGDAMPRPSSIADRLNMLETSQIGWKGRVEESDAKQFTLEHKLGGNYKTSGYRDFRSLYIFMFLDFYVTE